jgi:predicted SAM-dependent methyltransferase
VVNIVTWAVKKTISSVLPRDLSAEVVFELRGSVRHFRSWVLRRSNYRGRKNLKLNIGCGSNVVRDWINIDLTGPPGVLEWDCRRGMPFDDGSVDIIFAEHLFEHFSPVAASKFLLECRRCLRIGGVIRIIVPDAGKYLLLYKHGWDDIVPIRPLIEENGKYRDYWLGNVYRTKMEFINEVFRQGSEHKYAYDAETLIQKMLEAGFTDVRHQEYKVSTVEEASLDSLERRSDSLYVEAIR